MFYPLQLLQPCKSLLPKNVNAFLNLVVMYCNFNIVDCMKFKRIGSISKMFELMSVIFSLIRQKV